MRAVLWVLCTLWLCSMRSVWCLQCYDCYIDGQTSLGLMQPHGPYWNQCSGVPRDIVDCEDGGVCIEIVLASDTSSDRYQVLRSCSQALDNEELCQAGLELDPGVVVKDCQTCTTDLCNQQLN